MHTLFAPCNNNFPIEVPSDRAGLKIRPLLMVRPLIVQQALRTYYPSNRLIQGWPDLRKFKGLYVHRIILHRSRTMEMVEKTKGRNRLLGWQKHIILFPWMDFNNRREAPKPAHAHIRRLPRLNTKSNASAKTYPQHLVLQIGITLPIPGKPHNPLLNKQKSFQSSVDQTPQPQI